MSDEFDASKFGETQPLTFEGVPWPVLRSPFLLKIDDVDWTAVKAVFEAVKEVVSSTVYRELLQKSQRRFHEDRWRSRALLSSVEDEALRIRLEAAAKFVFQQVAELLTESLT